MNDFKHLVRKHLEEGTEVPRFYCCCGKQDSFFHGAKEFAEYAKGLGFPIEFEEGEGRHDWEYWDKWLPIMLGRMLKKEEK